MVPFMEIYGRAKQDTDDSKIWRMRIACWITYLFLFHDNNGDTNTPQRYVYTYIACLVR